MFERGFGDEAIVSDKDFGAYFDFTIYSDGQILPSPHPFLEGLGEIERHDGADLLVTNRKGFTGLRVPYDEVDPAAGIWIKTPGVGWRATLRLDSGNSQPSHILSCRSKDRNDLVNDVLPGSLSGRFERQKIHLHSAQATYYFIYGGDGETFLRFGTFLDISDL